MGDGGRRSTWIRVNARPITVAFASGVGALGGSYAVAGRTPGFVVTPLTWLVVDWTPGVLVTAAIRVFGDTAQDLVLATGLLAAVGLFAVSAGCARAAAHGRSVPASPLVVAVTSVVAFGLVGDAASAVAAGLGAALPGWTSELGRRTAEPTVSPDRRAAMAGLLSALGAALFGWVIDGTRTGSAAPKRARGDETSRRLLERALDQALEVDGLEPLVSTQFYEVDINAIDPRVRRNDWTLSVTGAVDAEREYSFADVREFPAEYRFVTLRCVGDPLNGTKLDNALWTGVPLSEFLRDASLTEDACCVVLRAADGFYMELPLAAVEDALVAFEMNGRPLPREHGAPARVLVPGHWGEVNVKWLTAVEVTEASVEGYWEKRGWHGTGPVNTVAKLHAVNRTGRRIEVAGHAYAGTRGIRRVEVSIDGGKTWQAAELTDPLPGRVPVDEKTPSFDGRATDAWRGWRLAYDPPAEPHEVVVRAVDGTGTVQPRERDDPFPSGATGWVSRTIEP